MSDQSLEMEIKHLMIDGFDQAMSLAKDKEVECDLFGEWARHALLSMFLASNDLDDIMKTPEQRRASLEKHLTEFVAACRHFYDEYLKEEAQGLTQQKPLSILRN